MDWDSGRETGLRFVLANKCSARFRQDFWLSLGSERPLASSAPEFWCAMGLERTAHDLIRCVVARNFSWSANCPRGPRRAGSGIEHSRTRLEISSGRRSADAESGGPRLLPATCSNLPQGRRAARWFAKLSAPSVRRASSKSTCDVGAIDEFL